MDDDVFSALMTPQARQDPYPTYRGYQAEKPVLNTGNGLWFLFGYADSLAMLRDRRVSVDGSNALNGGPPDELPTLIHLDPPAHTRLRRLVQMAFTPRRIDAIRTRAEELVVATLERFDQRDEIDIVAELAYPMPLTIICDLLGVGCADRDLVRNWSAWLARSIDPAVLRSDEENTHIALAQKEFSEYVAALIVHRRKCPGDDLLSQLVAAEMEGDRLNETELIGLAVLLLVAGHETTVSLIGNGLLALLRNPAAFDHLRNTPGSERAVVEELLRYDSPVQMTSRVALEPIDLPTATIPTGHVAVLLLGAANHDPLVFNRPDELSVDAGGRVANLAFGSGIHHCLGAALARAEGEVAIAGLVRRFPRMQLASEPMVRSTFVLRGREELRIRLS